MNIEDSYRWDQHDRLQALGKDEEVGGLVKHLINCRKIYEELAEAIMALGGSAAGLEAGKKFILEKYKWYLETKP